MEGKTNDLKFSKFYRLITPNEMDIDREEIFYRQKYNDIINYLKIILTNDEESVIQSYAKFIRPKGAILIKVNPGTDIVDYLKLISKNYYLNFFELNHEEIVKAPDEFISNFIDILESIIERTLKNIENETKNNEISRPNEHDPGQSKIKGLLIIDQQKFSSINLNGKNILELFMVSYKNRTSLIKDGLVLIWINNTMKEIKKSSQLIFDVFDLFIKVPILDKIERETIFRAFSEKNPKIVFDIKTLVDYTADWETKDLLQLLKIGIFKHFLNSELNESSNEITDGLINLIESGEYIPTTSETERNIENSDSHFHKNNEFSKKNSMNGRNIESKNIYTQNLSIEIKEERFTDFMLNQLYENAASKNYTELVLIIDKLNKNEHLEEIERKILSKYAFIFNDSPNMAQINLEKAKKRIDNLKRAFGEY
ncbi:MAG TPA: hypothetical protein VMV43_04475 [Candidatus Nanopelagicaceae bacterium]|nr:hypothetical protein [Candidatus Nanopelagicaceae bacterium]